MGETSDEAIRYLCVCIEEKGETMCRDVWEERSHPSCIGVLGGDRGIGVCVLLLCVSMFFGTAKEVVGLREVLLCDKFELKEVKVEIRRLNVKWQGIVSGIENDSSEGSEEHGKV